MIDEEGKVLTYKDVKDFFLSKYREQEHDNFKGILYLVVPFTTKVGGQKTLGEGAVTPRSANHCILYLGELVTNEFKFTVLHETAHVFGLYHAFLDRGRLAIPKQINNLEEVIERNTTDIPHL